MSAPTNEDDWEEDHREDLRVMREHWQQEADCARAEAARRKLDEEIRKLKSVRHNQAWAESLSRAPRNNLT